MDNKDILKKLSEPYYTYEKTVKNGTRVNLNKSIMLGRKILVDRLKPADEQNPEYEKYEVLQVETLSGNEPMAVEKNGETLVLTDGFNRCLVEEKLWPLFSTISLNLEPNGWGTRYPILLNALCNSKVNNNQLLFLLHEIFSVRKQFRKLKIKDIYLDYNDKKKKVICENPLDYEDNILKFFTSNLPHESVLNQLLDATLEALLLEANLELKTF